MLLRRAEECNDLDAGDSEDELAAHDPRSPKNGSSFLHMACSFFRRFAWCSSVCSLYLSGRSPFPPQVCGEPFSAFALREIREDRARGASSPWNPILLLVASFALSDDIRGP